MRNSKIFRKWLNHSVMFFLFLGLSSCWNQDKIKIYGDLSGKVNFWCAFQDSADVESLTLRVTDNNTEDFSQEALDGIKKVQEHFQAASDVMKKHPAIKFQPILDFPQIAAAASIFDDKNEKFQAILFYDPIAFSSSAETPLKAYSILMHQLGHFFHNHHDGLPVSGARPSFEKLADQFIGEVAAPSRIRVDSVLYALNSFLEDGDVLGSFSAKEVRLADVKNGFVNANVGKKTFSFPFTDQIPTREADYGHLQIKWALQESGFFQIYPFQGKFGVFPQCLENGLESFYQALPDKIAPSEIIQLRTNEDKYNFVLFPDKAEATEVVYKREDGSDLFCLEHAVTSMEGFSLRELKAGQSFSDVLEVIQMNRFFFKKTAVKCEETSVFCYDKFIVDPFTEVAQRQEKFFEPISFQFKTRDGINRTCRTHAFFYMTSKNAMFLSGEAENVWPLASNDRILGNGIKEEFKIGFNISCKNDVVLDESDYMEEGFDESGFSPELYTNTDGVNVRESPSTQSIKLAYLKEKGERVVFVEVASKKMVIAGKEGQWIKILYGPDQKPGFIFSAYLDNQP